MEFTSSIITAVKNLMSGNSVNKKDNILVLSQSCMDNINKYVLPSIEHLIKSVDAIPDKSGLVQLGVSLGLKTRDKKDVLNTIKDFFERAETCLHGMSRVIEKDFPTLITAKTTTFKVGTVLRVIDDISSMSLFCLDILYYAISNPDSIDKAYSKHINGNYASFCSLFMTYNRELEEITKKAPSISNEIISLDGPTSFSDTLARKSGDIINLPTNRANNFIYNPIYHIRLWLVDRDIEKYNANKDKKELLELKVLSLKLAKDDPNADIEKIDKQIAYYEEKITDLNYKIERFENS